MSSAGLRIPFVRDLMDSIHRRERASAERLALRLPTRLKPHLSPERLVPGAVDAAIPLDEGEELLLAIDDALGDGSGRVLEEAAFELTLRGLLRGTLGALVGGDFADTVSRMRAALERPFIGVQLDFELERTGSGLELVLGIATRPRAARILRYLATGIIRATFQFLRAGDVATFRILGEVVGDRARLTIRYRLPSVPVEAEPTANLSVPPARRLSREPRSAVTNVSAEVDRILVSARNSVPPPSQGQRRASVDGLPAVRVAPTPRVDTGPGPYRRTSGALPAVRPPEPDPSALLDELAAAARTGAESDGSPPRRPSRPPSIPPGKR